MIVFDQTLKNNSNISLVNTNVLRAEDKYTANVSGTQFTLFNKANTYDIYGVGTLSNINASDSSEIGYNYEVGFEKCSGNFTFDLYHSIISDKYNPNDMGFLGKNNEIENEIELSYKTFDPFWKIINTTHSFSISQVSLYKPYHFSYIHGGYHSMTSIRTTCISTQANYCARWNE